MVTTERSAFIAGLLGMVVTGSACNFIWGLQSAELYQDPDGGATTTGSGGAGPSTSSATSSSTTGGSDAGTPQPVVLAHLQNISVAAVAADPNTGAIYLTGSFSGTATIGQDTFTSMDKDDMFLAKLDVHGNVEWAKQFGGVGDQRGTALAFANGAVTVVGLNDTYLTGTTLTVEGKTVQPGTFYVRYDASGAVLWVSPCGGGFMSDVAVDPTNGDAVVTGFFNSAFCGTQQVQSQGDLDILVLRLASATGAQVKLNTFTGGSLNYSRSVTVDNFSNVFFGGWVYNSTKFGYWTIGEATAGYLTKIASDSNIPWAHSLGPGKVAAVRTNAVGDVLTFAGCLDANSTFGGDTPAPGQGPICIAKLTGNTGSYSWARRFGTPANGALPIFDAGGGAVSSAGDVVACGSTSGSLSFDGIPVTATGWVAYLDGSTGMVKWVQSIGFKKAFPAFSMKDSLVLAGTFGPGNIKIGETSLATAPGETDSFVAVIP
jgi:hypothetical protein